MFIMFSCMSMLVGAFGIKASKAIFLMLARDGEPASSCSSASVAGAPISATHRSALRASDAALVLHQVITFGFQFEKPRGRGYGAMPSAGQDSMCIAWARYRCGCGLCVGVNCRGYGTWPTRGGAVGSSSTYPHFGHRHSMAGSRETGSTTFCPVVHGHDGSIFH
jgi:hypothetical protein